MLALDWPATPDEVLAWARVVLLWMVVNYLVAADPAGRRWAASGPRAGVPRVR